MILYKKKNDDLAEIDNLIDRAFILLGMTYPFVRFMTHSFAARDRVPFATDSGPVWWFETLVLSAFLISLMLFAGRLAQRLYLRQPINVPKLLLLAAAVPMHWIVLRSLETVQPAGAAALVAVSTLTIYHNIQYHRIIWFHNRNKYCRAGAAGLRRGVEDKQDRVALHSLCAGLRRGLSHPALHNSPARQLCDGLHLGRGLYPLLPRQQDMAREARQTAQRESPHGAGKRGGTQPIMIR